MTRISFIPIIICTSLAMCKKPTTEKLSTPEQRAALNLKLSYAARDGNVKSILPLIGEGAEVNGFSYGDTPLMMAASYDRVEILELLLSQGAKIDLQELYNGDELGASALIRAAERRRAKSIKFLLGKGANPNLQRKTADSSLGGVHPLIATFNSNMYAYSETEHVESVEALIAAGAKINLPDDCGRTSLDWAEHYGFSGLIPVLKRHGAQKGLKLKCDFSLQDAPDDHTH